MTAPESVDQIIDAASSETHDFSGADDRRAAVRHPYDELVGLVLLDALGRRTEPFIVRARDISPRGLCLTCRHPLEVNLQGVVQLVRSTGRLALAGVQVMRCDYEEEERHDIGLAFTPLPASMTKEEFLDAEGRLRMFDPLLKENVHE